MTTTISTFAVDIHPALAPDADAVILFSGPGCQQCRAAKRHLDSRRIAYHELDATASLSQKAIEALRAAGFGQLPVAVWPDGQVSSGYRPDLIDAWAARTEATP